MCSGNDYKHSCSQALPFIVGFITSKYSGRSARTWAVSVCLLFKGRRNFRNIMSLIPCTFLQSLYLPTNALRDTIYVKHTKTSTCFGTRVSSSGIDSKESVWANVLINVLFIVMSLIETLVFKIIKCTKIHKTGHRHHKHQGLDPLIRSVSKVTTALSNVSSVFQFFSFLLVCSSMVSKRFGFLAFFASVETSWLLIIYGVLIIS